MPKRAVKALEKMLEAIYRARQKATTPQEFNAVLDRELIEEEAYRKLTGHYYHIKAKQQDNEIIRGNYETNR